MGVEDLLSPNVVVVSENASLSEAARLMASNDVSCLAILDDKDLVGLITERDMTRSVADGADAKETRVVTYASSILVTVDVSASKREATRVMVELGVRHLPVVAEGEVVGIISARDLLERVEPESD